VKGDRDGSTALRLHDPQFTTEGSHPKPGEAQASCASGASWGAHDPVVTIPPDCTARAPSRSDVSIPASTNALAASSVPAIAHPAHVGTPNAVSGRR
jgi:hypothetical protein